MKDLSEIYWPRILLTPTLTDREHKTRRVVLEML